MPRRFATTELFRNHVFRTLVRQTREINLQNNCVRRLLVLEFMETAPKASLPNEKKRRCPSGLPPAAALRHGLSVQQGIGAFGGLDFVVSGLSFQIKICGWGLIILPL